MLPLFLHSRDMPARAVRLTPVLSQPFLNLVFPIPSLFLTTVSLERGAACYVPCCSFGERREPEPSHRLVDRNTCKGKVSTA